MQHRLQPLMAPRSIAVLGASADPARIGGAALHGLAQLGFAGEAYAINPKYAELAGRPCYPDLAALPGPVDLAILALPAGQVLDQLRAAAAAGVRAALVYSAGFEETGTPEGLARSAALTDFADETGMVICGPNCMGGVSLPSRAYTSFVTAFTTAQAGDLAILTQSGNMAAMLYRMAERAGLGFSHIVNTGNESCVAFAEYLDYLLDDPATQAVIGYVEGLRDGARFLRVARAFRERGKLLGLLRAGRTAKGAEAARSHTAALAGDVHAFEAACRATGVVLAEDAQHLVDIAYLHRFRDRRMGRGAAVVTISGASGALLADALTPRGIMLPSLPSETQQALRRLVPDYGMVGNPVDITGNAVNSMEDLRSIMGAVLAAPVLDQVVLYIPGALLQRALPQLGAAAQQSDRLVMAVDNGVADNRAAAEAAGLAYFPDMTWAARALASYVDWRSATLPAIPAGTAGEAPEAARSLLAAARGAGLLDEAAGKRLLSAVGIPPVPEVLATTAEAAVAAAEHLGWPVVAKISSPDIAHKTELGGVRLDLADAAAVREAFAAILASVASRAPGARIEGISIQPQIRGGVELLLGATRDAAFGWMITVGLGGVWTELMGDVRHALAPVTAEEAEALLRRLKGFSLLDGYRRAPRMDVAAAARAVAALSEAAVALDAEMTEIEINPLLVRAEGQGAVAADALVVLQGSPGRSREVRAGVG